MISASIHFVEISSLQPSVSLELFVCLILFTRQAAGGLPGWSIHILHALNSLILHIPKHTKRRNNGRDKQNGRRLH